MIITDGVRMLKIGVSSHLYLIQDESPSGWTPGIPGQFGAIGAEFALGVDHLDHILLTYHDIDHNEEPDTSGNKPRCMFGHQ
ncbi:MAG: hypothetical protein M1493_09500 [Firmicutes bacterium]|jgi:hypothetical protein|uniref:Uncharacterized protein n=1 Tax=Sulfobacillus benefaciens TaxID=453960 RepID=A0A2T2WZD7_9FIRM|nr:hypothetical protein [Bacillota bacterium]PSR27597.1 MAG: hypothetical protein C7B43_11610 [Sulfobacillus benefaciens]